MALVTVAPCRSVKISPSVLAIARSGGRLSSPAVDGRAGLRRGRGGTVFGRGGSGVPGGGAGLGDVAGRSKDGRERWRARGAARSGYAAGVGREYEGGFGDAHGMAQGWLGGCTCCCTRTGGTHPGTLGGRVGVYGRAGREGVRFSLTGVLDGGSLW